MRRGPRQPGSLPATLLAALAGWATGEAGAQPVAPDGGPVVVGENTDRLRWFELDRFGVTADFYTRYLRQHQDTPAGGDQTDTELLFRESLGISSRFFLGHENLADVLADFSLGLEDNFIDSETQGLEDEHETGVFTLFDVNALILGEGPAPLTLFARRNETLLDRAFAGSIDSTTTEFGASVSAFREIAPTSLRYSHRELEQDRQGPVGDDTLTQDTFQVQSQWSSENNHRITLNYDLDFVDEQRERTRDTSYTRHDGILVHTYGFGSDTQHNLRSQLQVFDQTGDFELRRLRLFETLTLRHSDTLETRYDVTAESQESGGQDQQFFSGLFTLRHELFDSLVTTFNAGGNFTELSDSAFSSTELLTGLNFEYTKLVPLGRLDMSLALNLSHQEDEDRSDPINFVNMPRSFPDAGPLLISGRNIIPGSVVLTDSTGNRLFSDSFDYRLSAFPDRVELRRVIGGPIDDGDTVLVDYQIGPEPAATIETITGAIAARYTFDESWVAGLSPYILFRDISQEISPDSVDRVPFDSTTTRIGADYTLGYFTVNAEYEDQDNTIAPLEALRASVRYERPLGLNSYVRADLSHETLDFGDDGSSVDFERALAEWGYAFSNGINVKLRALYRQERDSIAGDTQGFEQSLEFNWRFRQTELALSVRNALLEGDDVSTDAQAATFTLRRRF